MLIIINGVPIESCFLFFLDEGPSNNCKSGPTGHGLSIFVSWNLVDIREIS